MQTIKAHDWVTDIDIPIPGRRANLSLNQLDHEAILFGPADGSTYRLNQTALAVWQRCDGKTTIRDMARSLTQEYEVDFETALDDVEQLCALFADADLFER